MRRLPPLGAIEAFVQVARLGSVKAAATELALSAPALSRRVQALERVMDKAAARDTRDTFVPSRETRTLGGTILNRGLVGPCRADMLGNLNCR